MHAPEHTHARPRITIVGAGMSGLLMAIYLHRRGYGVDIYERRPDLRRTRSEERRSVNMTLSVRGLEALLQVDLGHHIESIITPLKGRIIHAPEGTMFQPYGKNDAEVLYGVKRDDLNSVLLEAVERLSDVRMFFEQRLVKVDKRTGWLTFRDEFTGEERRVASEVLIGADGTFSAVRHLVFRGERVDYHQECLSWGYKELTIPGRLDDKQLLRRDGLHVWARPDCMLIASANHDSTFTCTCFMPFEGEISFGALQSEEQVARFFADQFVDLAPVVPSIVHSFTRNRAEPLITTRCAPWYYRDRAVLIGDACHSVYPFYGQGMNAALEDCRVLDECMGRYPDGDWKSVFRAFQAARKRHTDVLAELSKQNFVELTQSVNSPRFVARKKIDLVLNRLFPEQWIPLYTLVSHTSMPYADAVERVQRQHQRASLLGLNVIIALLATVLVLKESCTSLAHRVAGFADAPRDPPGRRVKLPASPDKLAPERVRTS
jgi:kynurenine 3-monooxygenase